MSEDYKLNSPAEQYLQEHHGRLTDYYNYVANGSSYRQAFAYALSKPDVYRLRTAGLMDHLLEPGPAPGDIDDNAIHMAIQHLEETLYQFPEDHPLWNLR